MREISKDKLRQAAKFLDEKPKALSSAACKDEYWRQLINALPQRIYTNSQIEGFAEEILTPRGSPALKLLVDLRERGLEYEAFLDCLEKIKCYNALNLFIQSTVPEITLHPEDQMVRVGGTLVLKCCAKCIPSPPDYQWHFNGVPMRNMRNPVLRIDDVHTYVAGSYACKVTNKHINDPNHNFVWTRPAKVNVETIKLSIPESCADDTMGSSQWGSTTPSSSSNTDSTYTSIRSNSLVSRSDIAGVNTNEGDIVIQKHPSNLTCHYNKPFKLECHAQSKQGKTLKFTWMMKRRGRSSVTELHAEYSETSSTLFHTWPKHETIIIYCEITHKDGDSSEKAISNKVEVSVKTLWIVDQPRSVSEYIGKPATLHCRAEGKGPIEYMWLKTLEDSRKKKISEFKPNGTLHFPMLESDIWGYYTCHAQNADEFVPSKTVSVKFRAKNEIDLAITFQPLSFVCQRGESATLSCTAEPAHGTKYHWYFNDSPMSDRVRECRKSKLSFSKVTDSNFGQYHCVVSNGGKKLKSRKVFLIPGNRPIDSGMFKTDTQLSQAKAEHSFSSEDGKVSYARAKIALLIGNQEYMHINSLTSPHSDVIELKNTLENMGFNVFAYFDLNSEETMIVLENVSKLLGPGMYLFLYYSGHGFNSVRTSMDYIVPVDASSPLKCVECISSNLVTGKFQRTLCKCFMFFDCCRVSYKSGEDDRPSSASSSEQCAFSNLFKILSCSAQRSAYERNSQACSVFNRALRDGLEKRKNAVRDLGPHISEVMQKEGQTKGGKEFQRPVVIMKMLPTTMNLHEEVMRDTWSTNQDQGQKGDTLYKINYAVQKEVDLRIADLAMAKVTLAFTAINQLKVVSKPVNFSLQCKKMNVQVLSETPGVSITEKEINDGTECIICGLLKVEKGVLDLRVIFTIITEKGSEETSNCIQIPLDHCVYLPD